MSLLLDALKKAAEKKAEKDDSSLQATVDETVLDATQVDETQQLPADGPDETMQMGPLHDETQLDETRVEGLSGNDSELVAQNLRDAIEAESADETIVDQTIFDQTELDQTEMQTQLVDQDDPELTEQMPSGEDSTQTLTAEQPAQMGGDDETLIFDDEDVSEFLGEPRFINDDAPEDTEVATQSTGADDTDLATESMPQADATETNLQDLSLEEQTDVAELDHGEDMSLLLVDDDLTSLQTQTSMTDPQRSATRLDLLRDSNATEGLSMQDLPDAASSTATTRTAGSITTQVGADEAATVTRADSTSTATYAPDNYDRTLLRVQNEDASRLFTGMQSDSDAVMTPDYAKKVFQSKSSAQTWQSLRVYSGVMVVILLAVGVLGLFEFQDEVESIDNRLRPLSRDPMPGPIVKAEKESTNLFDGGAEVDARTRQLVETADQLDNNEAIAELASASTVESGESTLMQTNAEEKPEIDEVLTVDSQAEETVSAVDVASASPKGETDSATPVNESVEVAATKTGGESESSLSISSSTKAAEKDIWLREAYAAYRSGDDALALQKYNRVLAVDPGNRNALLARAAIAIQDNRGRDAVMDYQRLLEANPRDSLAMSSMLAVSSIAPKQAESQLKLMLRDEPNSPHLNFALGNVYGVQDRWQEAQRHYFTALENNPDDPNYAYNLAVSLEHIAKPGVAADFYQRALDTFDMGMATFSRQVVEQRLGVLQ